MIALIPIKIELLRIDHDKEMFHRIILFGVDCKLQNYCLLTVTQNEIVFYIFLLFYLFTLGFKSTNFFLRNILFID